MSTKTIFTLPLEAKPTTRAGLCPPTDGCHETTCPMLIMLTSSGHKPACYFLKLSSDLPAARASLTQAGCFPRPDQTSPLGPT